MNLACFFLTQTGGTLSGVLANLASMDEDMRNQLLLVLLLGVLTLGLLIWAAFYRKARRRRHHRHRPHTWQLDPNGPKSGRGHRHHERRHRSEHRKPPMNPTLAETGGLPPRRPEDQPPEGA